MKEIILLESKILKWCESNGISFFEGELKGHQNTFQINTENRAIEFLELGKKLNISHIILCREYFSFDEFSWEYIEKAGNDDELRMLIEDALAKLPDYENKLISITLFWAKDGIIYKSFQQAKWVSKFTKKIEDLIEDYKDKLLEEKRKMFPYSREKRASLAKALASHEDYLRFSSRHKQLEAIMKNLMIDLDIEINDFNLTAAKKIIKPEAYRLFTAKYSSKAIDRLKMQIKAMNKKGYSKAETIAKLDITEGLYNKFK